MKHHVYMVYRIVFKFLHVLGDHGGTVGDGEHVVRKYFHPFYACCEKSYEHFISWSLVLWGG